jgi:hypothetical protein
VLKAAEKGRAYFEVMPKIKPESWYKNTKLSSVDTTHTYTPNWMAKMGVEIEGVSDLCEEEMGIQVIQPILYTWISCTRRRLTCDCPDKQIPLKTIYEKGDTAAREEIIKYLKDIERDVWKGVKKI